MLATNHALTGIAIGYVLPLPVAIPVAFCSHFVLDMIPHYGLHDKRRDTIWNRLLVFADTGMALSLAVSFVIMGEWNVFITGWAAYIPDSYWVYLYFKQKGSMHIKIKSKFGKFHKKIQREYPWGLAVEIPIMITLFIVVLHLFLS